MLIRFLLEAAYSADARRAYRSTRNGRRRQDGPSERCRSRRTLAGWGVRARVAVGSKPDFRRCVSRMELTIDILILRLCACRRTTDLTFDRLLGVKAQGMASPLLRRRRTGRMGAIGHTRRGSHGRRPRRHSIDRSKSSVAAYWGCGWSQHAHRPSGRRGQRHSPEALDDLRVALVQHSPVCIASCAPTSWTHRCRTGAISCRDGFDSPRSGRCGRA